MGNYLKLGIFILRYFSGAYYPIGGASEIPYRIVPVIERMGGRVLMKAPVCQILTEGGRVTGVRVGKKENNAVDIYAPIVISDAGRESNCKFLKSQSSGCRSNTVATTTIQTKKKPIARSIIEFSLLIKVSITLC